MPRIWCPTIRCVPHTILPWHPQRGAKAPATKTRKSPNLREKNFAGKNFDIKLKNEVFPTNVSPDEVPPPL